jgi:tetratricopeptide (TPR) repeat protein
MLAGQPPFQGSLPALLKQHLHDPVPRLRDRYPDLAYPVGLDGVLAQAMAKDPAQRPRTAAELYRLARAVYQDSLANPLPVTPFPRQAAASPPQRPAGVNPIPRPAPAQSSPPQSRPAATPVPPRTPAIDPVPTARSAALAQLPVGELLADLSAQLSAADPGGKWRKATRLGGTVLQHTYRHKELYLKALNDLKGTLKPGFNQAEALLRRGQTYLNQRDFKQALLDFTHALQTNSPFKADLFYWRGVTHKALKNNKAARADFRQAARLGHTAAGEALRDLQPGFFEVIREMWQNLTHRHPTTRISRP